MSPQPLRRPVFTKLQSGSSIPHLLWLSVALPRWLTMLPPKVQSSASPGLSLRTWLRKASESTASRERPHLSHCRITHTQKKIDSPGPVHTPLQPASRPAEMEGFGTKSQISHPGQPSEIAPTFVFLASPEASLYYGQIMHPYPMGYVLLLAQVWLNLAEYGTDLSVPMRNPATRALS